MHASKWLLTDIIKQEYGFKGFFISDMGDVENLATSLHQIAENQKEAVCKSVNAGLDMHMYSADSARFVRTGTPAISLCPGIIVIHPASMAALKGGRKYERSARSDTSKAGEEIRSSGIHWAFAPCIDIVQDARWGRTGETYGEDPFLTSELVKEAIRGYQDSVHAYKIRNLQTGLFGQFL